MIVLTSIVTMGNALMAPTWVDCGNQHVATAMLDGVPHQKPKQLLIKVIAL